MTKKSIVAGRRSIKAVLSTVIAILLIVATFTSTAFAQTNYRVQIVDGAEEITVTTNETEPIEILNDAGITLTSDDVIDITKFEAHEGGTITISRNNTINVKFGETIKTYKVYAATVGDALNEIGIKIGKDDKLNLDASTPVENGMTVEIESALTVTLKVDGKTEKLTSTNSTVGDLRKLAGLTLGEYD